jgi:uncharacterized HAD superfamily protein
MSILYAGYEDMWQVVLDMARRMPKVDAIAGVPVSGLAPAGMLSAATGIKAVPLESVPDSVKRLLVLEDASGFSKCIAEKIGQKEGREVLYGTVYACDRAINDFDLVGCIAPKPRIFTWNLLKSNKTSLIAYDLDGVLCRDPLVAEIDYADKYLKFINEVEPIRKTLTTLGWVVTGRMERYRAQTAHWLDRNGIRVKELVMAKDDQKHTMDAHARHKAQWLQDHPECILFVESSPVQAKRIAELTGRAVVCATTDESWNTTPAQMIAVKPVAKNSKIIYTISTGAYQEHAPRDFTPPEGWDYRVITDADCPAYLSNKQKAAWAKINAPRLFAEYEASLCIDDDMKILKDPMPLFEGKELVFLERESVSTWHTDLMKVVNERKAATQEQAQAEINRLTLAGFSDSRNWMTGVIWRKHTEQARALCDEWWYWYSQSETQRDQPSLAVACQKLGIAPDAITEWRGERGMIEYILHDNKKATRNGTRHIVEQQKPVMQHRRRGDR